MQRGPLLARPHPDLAAAHNNLAYVLVLQGRDLERARRHVETALRSSPGNPDYLTTLGALELKGGSLPQARAALEAALRAQPGFPDALGGLEEVRRRETGAPPR